MVVITSDPVSPTQTQLYCGTKSIGGCSSDCEHSVDWTITLAQQMGSNTTYTVQPWSAQLGEINVLNR